MEQLLLGLKALIVVLATVSAIWALSETDQRRRRLQIIFAVAGLAASIALLLAEAHSNSIQEAQRFTLIQRGLFPIEPIRIRVRLDVSEDVLSPRLLRVASGFCGRLEGECAIRPEPSEEVESAETIVSDPNYLGYCRGGNLFEFREPNELPGMRDAFKDAAQVRKWLSQIGVSLRIGIPTQKSSFEYEGTAVASQSPLFSCRDRTMFVETESLLESNTELSPIVSLLDLSRATVALVPNYSGWGFEFLRSSLSKKLARSLHLSGKIRFSHVTLPLARKRIDPESLTFVVDPDRVAQLTKLHTSVGGALTNENKGK